MCDLAGWPVGARAEVCAKTVPPPIAEERSIALTSDFIANSSSNDDAPTPIDRSRLPLPESWSSQNISGLRGSPRRAPHVRLFTVAQVASASPPEPSFAHVRDWSPSWANGPGRGHERRNPVFPISFSRVLSPRRTGWVACFDPCARPTSYRSVGGDGLCSGLVPTIIAHRIGGAAEGSKVD
jgi:hypothetical protein